MSSERELRYLPLERLALRRPVDRISYVRDRCRGKRVLDLGALDETEVFKGQHEAWKWLHREMARSALEVMGIDSSERLRLDGPLRTSFGTTIHYGRVEDLSGILAEFRPDLVVAGELLEHTADPSAWLAALGRIRPGLEILLTTPNATSLPNIGLALVNREMMHRDHMCVYSYKTLMTLGRRIGLQDIRITPYYYRPHLLRGRAPALLVPAIALADRLILLPVQFLFPLTAGGFILEGIFPSPAVV
jgi:hypothetical protein